VHDRRGVERLAGTDAPPLASCDLAQLRVQGREDPLRGRGIATARGVEQLRDRLQRRQVSSFAKKAS
jgi:hypothetical protein